MWNKLNTPETTAYTFSNKHISECFPDVYVWVSKRHLKLNTSKFTLFWQPPPLTNSVPLSLPSLPTATAEVLAFPFLTPIVLQQSCPHRPPSPSSLGVVVWIWLQHTPKSSCVGNLVPREVVLKGAGAYGKGGGLSEVQSRVVIYRVP